jgi:hypothetical protein
MTSAVRKRPKDTRRPAEDWGQLGPAMRAFPNANMNANSRPCTRTANG